MNTVTIPTKRTNILLSPSQKRVVLRPFQPGEAERVERVIQRVAQLTEQEVELFLKGLLIDFRHRHQRPESFFLRRFEDISHFLPSDHVFSNQRKLLLGAYFTQEFAIESAALFNPSIVWHPDQTNLPSGSKRFAMSLRAVGEGHVSSIVFRSGTISADAAISVEGPAEFSTTPELVPDASYDNKLFQRKLDELGLKTPDSDLVFATLSSNFTLQQLEEAFQRTIRVHTDYKPELSSWVDQIIMLAKSNYAIHYSPEIDLSERTLFPLSPTESNGIEDARFVRFEGDDQRICYYATYSAFNGKTVLPQLLETTDFLRFRMHTLNGSVVSNKGMALFPRRVRGHYAMLGRQDGENMYLMLSDNLYFWYTRTLLLKPKFPWEYMQIGNCGCPLETPKGWLVLTHGVGAMRRYCIGAILLDLQDPSKVLGRLAEPLILPNENERVGYVPNVVYTCGSIIHNKHLIVPYGTSDYATTFATVELEALLQGMTG